MAKIKLLVDTDIIIDFLKGVKTSLSLRILTFIVQSSVKKNFSLSQDLVIPKEKE